MNTKRKVEVYSADCPLCQKTIEIVKNIACPSCEVNILDINAPEVADRADQLEICSVPSVVIDGKLADCCAGQGPDEATLRAAGIGREIS